jgi:hypothetical protein
MALQNVFAKQVCHFTGRPRNYSAFSPHSTSHKPLENISFMKLNIKSKRDDGLPFINATQYCIQTESLSVGSENTA